MVCLLSFKAQATFKNFPFFLEKVGNTTLNPGHPTAATGALHLKPPRGERMMRKRITSTLAIIVMLIAAGATVSETTALAATKKRTCSCSRPNLRRRARTAATRVPRATAVTPNTYAAQDSPNAQVVGPVTATYHLEA